MKGIILAGGTGSRLQPITHTTQKQLIPLANKPVIQHVIERMRGSGISEIGVVLGNHYPEKVKNTLGDGSDLDVKISYIHQGEPLGLAHAVACCEEFVQEEPFLVYFGDTIIENKIIDNISKYFDEEKYDGSLVFQEVENPSRFGVAEIEDGDITGVLEKPDDPPSNLAYVGAVVLTKKVFSEIEHLEPSWRGELELTHALDRLVKNGNVHWSKESGLWKDVGTPNDVIETNKILMEREFEAREIREIDSNGSSSIAKDVTIRGPVMIGENTSIKGESTIGPYTCIGDNCEISDSHIKSSVIMDNVEINSKDKLTNSIIPNNSEISSPDEDFSRLVISEDTVIK